MSRIDDLIEQHCPDGVEFRPVAAIANVGTGSSNRNEEVTEGKYPFYVRSKDVLRIDEYEFDEKAIVIPGEGGIGEVFHYVEGKYALHQRAYRIHFITTDVDTKFAYYYLSAHFKLFILQKAVSATVTSIRKPMIEDFPIPVPPIEVQREIVAILDKFTQLEAELEAELEARRKQYEHYRNELLSFKNVEGGVRWISMGDAFTMEAGKFISADKISATQTPEFLYPCFGANGLRGYVSDFNTSGNLLAIGRQGALCGNVTRTVGDFYATEHAVVVKPKDAINIDWAYHLLAFMNLNQYATKSAQPGLSVGNLLKLKMPLPESVMQTNAARILNCLDDLVNDISIGLPAEIEARRKQYEYYRDRLLTFKELDVA